MKSIISPEYLPKKDVNTQLTDFDIDVINEFIKSKFIETYCRYTGCICTKAKFAEYNENLDAVSAFIKSIGIFTKKRSVWIEFETKKLIEESEYYFETHEDGFYICFKNNY